MKERSDNLCNFYILPLLGYNKTSFGGVGNFVNSYLTQNLSHVVVELNASVGDFEYSKHYVTDITGENGNIFVFFEIEPKWAETIELFVQGKYSKFPHDAKLIIKQLSGLKYKMPRDGQLISSKFLLALDKDPDLRKKLEKELDVKLSHDAELVDIPGSNNFFQVSVEDVVHR